uniref:DHHW family protein n=1 Tax=Agathobacter sp. TaxID=2021311 RepID=UPI00405773BC
MNNRKDKIYVLIVTMVFAALTLFCWLKPADDFSMTERRKLNRFPEFTLQTVGNGKFMSEFESYTADQFPLRDTFRSIKAFVHKYVFGQSDNGGVYMADGYISKMEYPLSEKAIERVKNKLDYVYKTYIAGTEANVYYSLIPDKNYFIAEKHGYLAMNYDKLYAEMEANLEYMTYIDITDLLTIGDFYYTDTHWKQECILDVAQRLAGEMGVALEAEYEAVTLDVPFYGVYYGQLGLPAEPDAISYLSHPLFGTSAKADGTLKVYDHQNQKEIPVYNMELAQGRDPYEMYLSGSLSVITIENPNAATDKELVIFRDSFASSIAPLFAEAYAKITLLDIRYLNQNMIGNFVEFDNQDVLFLYSTSVVNNETAF